jgi:hypothetical protein
MGKKWTGKYATVTSLSDTLETPYVGEAVHCCAYYLGVSRPMSHSYCLFSRTFCFLSFILYCLYLSRSSAVLQS